MTIPIRFAAITAIFLFLLSACCAGTETSRSTGTYIDDKTISTKVKSQLAADSLTNAIKIEVETYSGVVQLSGFVASNEVKDRAEEITQKVNGVKDVENDLVIR